VTGWSERLAPAREALVRAGLDLHAVLSVARFDALVAPAFRSGHRLPAARSAWVVGSAGPRLFSHFQTATSGDPRQPDPLDAYVEAQLAAAMALAARAGAACAAIFGHRAVGGIFPDLVAAAREAGLGWPSRLGLLLHPAFGPWTSLRAVLLTDVALDCGSPLPGAGPCAECPAPCTAACPVAAPAARGFRVDACAGTRLAGGCAEHCAARRACPVGAGFRYAPAAEAHHMAAALRGLRART